ncbi:MAG TPA: hypothetical protein VMS17_05215 [Gemmataceae bacterium]|nr:hypothetical protein [Gemmataceae bacterium]
MVKRRSLIERVTATQDVDPALAEEFIYGRHPRADSEPRLLQATHRPSDAVTASEANETAPPEAKAQAAAAIAKAPITTRVRADFATALKRASLERQLNGVSPHTVQDILEAALEPWLRSNGYLP